MSIASIGSGIGSIIRGGAGAAGRVVRRYPGTTGTIGGIAGGALGGMIGSEGRPRRKTAKGVSGRDIQGFKRVCKLASKFSAAKSRGVKCKVGKRRSC